MNIITTYKDMFIFYDKNGNLAFGNKKMTSYRAKSVRSAKNRITRYINKLSKRERRSLPYLKYELKEQ